MTISYPTKVRNFVKTVPLNASVNDYTNKEGVRVSLPIYIDVSTSDRKVFLNAVREIANSSVTKEVPSVSGLRVTSSSNTEASVEEFLGMTLENLRNSLFVRGGLPIDLVLKLQAVTGIVLVDLKDIAAAMKAKQALIKEFVENFKFDD